MIRYDNLKPAVIRVLLGRERWENPRFVALRSHYGCDSFFCRPGKDGAHEKGGVEGEIGRFRRTHLTPVPRVACLAELNEVMAAADAAEDARWITGHPRTVGAMFATEAAALNPLPRTGFEASTPLTCRVDAKARICVRQSYYSVPQHLAGRRVTARLGARQIEVLAAGKIVAVHTRSLHKGTQDLLLDHYLEVLVRKPGALPGSTALAMARANGSFTATHQRFWDAARAGLGDAPGTRALIGVLLLHRALPAAAVITGMNTALAMGTFDADLVAISARCAHEGAPAPGPVVVPANAAPGAQLARPAPVLNAYDALLARRTPQEVSA
jgi:hypothetical protein